MRPLTLMLLAAASLSAVAMPDSVRAQDFPSGTWNGGGGAPQAPPAAVPQPPAEAAPAKPKPKPAAKKPKRENTAAKTDDADDGDGGGARRGGADSARIVLKVNDDPITAREIVMRQRMLGGGDIQEKVKANMQRLIKDPSTSTRLKAILDEVIKANEGKSKDEIIAIFEGRKKAFAQSLQKRAVESARASASPGVRKQAVESLIEERLKLQAAKSASVTVSDDEVNKQIGVIAQRNKMTMEQFEQHLKSMGMDIAVMRSRTRADLGWADVVRRKFGHQIAFSSRDVDRLISAAGGGEDGVELHVQRVSLQLLNKVDQKAIAQRQLEAEGARGRFQGCQTTGQLANSLSGAKFDDIGFRAPSSMPEPTRSLLLSAQDGEMLPPSVGPTGVELWVVCSRKTVSADSQKRAAAEDEVKQQEFQVRAKKYLRDLRNDAVIDDLEVGGT